MPDDETVVNPRAARFPLAEITPAEFEQFVAELLEAGEPGLENFIVVCHEKIEGVDGTYDFDATVRFRYLGMDFLVIVEAKYHTNSIKRELVQVLHAKARSVGAHKAALISTTQFQSGAIEYARIHNIALVSVTEGRFTYISRAAGPKPVLSREQAAMLYGLPPFVGAYCARGDQPGSTMLAIVSRDDSQRIQELLFGVAVDPHPDTTG